MEIEVTNLYPNQKPRKPRVFKKGSFKRGPKLASKRKKAKTSVWAEFGLKRPLYVRYTGYGGVLWYLVSRYVRQSEFKEHGGYCVDGCGRKVEDWNDADCGHFRSAKSLSTRFLRENLGLQTKYCNSPRGGNGNQYGFGKVVDQRYGQGTADRLTDLAKETSKPFSKEKYRTEILKIRRLLEELGDSDKK